MSAGVALGALVRARLTATRNRLTGSTRRARVVTLAVALLLAMYTIEVTRAVAQHYSAASDRDVLAAMSLLVLFVFGVTSSISAGLQAISDDDVYLIRALPVPPVAFFAIKLWDTAFRGVRFLVLAVPICAGLGLSRPGLGLVAWLAYCVGWICLWWLSAAFGLVGAAWAMRLSRGRGVSALTALLTATGILGFFGALAYFVGGDDGRALVAAQALATPSRMMLSALPTSWVAATATQGAAVYVLPVAGVLVVALGLAHTLFTRALGADAPLNGSVRRGARARRNDPRRGPIRALIVKDWRVTVRDGAVVVAWATPLLLQALFLVLVRRGWPTQMHEIVPMHVTALVVALFIGASLVSREKGAVACLRTCVVGRHRVMIAKAIAAGCVMAPIVGAWALSLERPYVHWRLAVTALGTSFAYAACAVGISAIAPASARPSGRAISVSLPAALFLYAFFAVSVGLAVFVDYTRAPLAWIAVIVPAVFGGLVLVLGGHYWTNRDVIE